MAHDDHECLHNTGAILFLGSAELTGVLDDSAFFFQGYQSTFRGTSGDLTTVESRCRLNGYFSSRYLNSGCPGFKYVLLHSNTLAPRVCFHLYLKGKLR